MKFKRKIWLILICMMLLCMCANGAFVAYVVTHPGPVPRWATLSLVCFLIVIVGIFTILLRRFARQMAQNETLEEGKHRRARARIWIKIGLIFYVLVLLNGIRLVVQDAILWKYAIVGLSVDVLLIAMFWKLLRRLNRSELTNKTATEPGTFVR